ncbi:MAG: hypothetical protein ACK56I_32990, partial [bacterium]
MLSFFSINPFFPLLLAHQPFAKSMPIISARGRMPLSPIRETLLAFMRVGELGMWWDNNQFTALVSMHVPEQIPLQ